MTAPASSGPTGRIVDGTGDAGGFVESVSELLEATLGFRPFPGTLNLDGVESLDALPSERYPLPGDDHCDGLVVKQCRVAGVRSAVIRPLVPGYPEEKTEVLAPVELRSFLSVETGDELVLTDAAECAAMPAIDGTEADQFRGVVFDLDGTLVDLAVDWPAVHARLEDLLGSNLDGPITDYTRAEVFELAKDNGVYDRLDDIVTSAEVEGAESAPALDALSVVRALECPVGICTANAEEAARVALDRFDVLDAVDAVVARDTIPEDKPHPRTLSRCLSDLGIGAGNALYVGDEDGDVELAVGVGASYAHVEQFSV